MRQYNTYIYEPVQEFGPEKHYSVGLNSHFPIPDRCDIIIAILHAYVSGTRRRVFVNYVCLIYPELPHVV